MDFEGGSKKGIDGRTELKKEMKREMRNQTTSTGPGKLELPYYDYTQHQHDTPSSPLPLLTADEIESFILLLSASDDSLGASVSIAGCGSSTPAAPEARGRAGIINKPVLVEM